MIINPKQLFVFSIFVFCIATELLGQDKIISGKVTDNEGLAVEGANVILTPLHKELVLAYDFTRNDGIFQIKLKAGYDSLRLNISHISYKSKVLPVANTDDYFLLVLEKGSFELNEVTIEEPPLITLNKDTLSYDVAKIQDIDDRSIGDVLDKLPGINVNAKGMIFYQGKPIGKFYIEGLDLLEGRYNLASENLPANSVESVEILLNHQPIKMLDSLVFTNRASLNLKLKKDITYTGLVEVGAGAKPLLRNIMATLMLFAKKKQAIGSFQSNNIGSDLEDQTQNLYGSDIQNESLMDDWLNIIEPVPPLLSKNRWLLNDGNLGSLNYLVKNDREMQTKINISYYADRIEKISSKTTQFYLPRDTITIVEDLNNQDRQKTLKSDITFEKNSNKKYFKNKTRFEYTDNLDIGLLSTNEDEIDQSFDNDLFMISNQMNYLIPVKKNIISFSSNVNYNRNQQRLFVTPGLFFNNRSNFQNLNLINFYTHNKVSALKKKGLFTFSTALGFKYHTQNLKSGLKTSITDNPADTLINNINLQRNVIYNNWKAEIRKSSWVVSLTLPLSLNYFKINNLVDEIDSVKYIPAIEPRVSLSNQFGTRWIADIAYSYNNQFGSIDKLYSGYILQNYRNLIAYSRQLMINNQSKFTLNIEYKDIINSVFMNSSYSYQRSRSNIQYNNVLSGAGILRRIALPVSNVIYSHSHWFEASKYFANTKTTLNFQSSIDFLKFNQIINDVNTDVATIISSLKPSINIKAIDWLKIMYEGNFSIFNNYQTRQLINSSHNYQHLISAIFYVHQSHILKMEKEMVSSNFQNTTSANTVYLNIEYNHYFGKERKKLYLQLTNLLNAKRFQNLLVDSFQLSEDNFILRPRQILIGFQFSF